MSEAVDLPVRRPWEGADWRNRGLLIVGESHYHYPGEDPDDPDKTIETVRNVIGGQKLSFFTAVKTVVTGAARGDTNPAEFLATIAFLNFCQGSADGPAGAKTSEMWNRGIAAFPDILRRLKPRRMVVFSSESRKRFGRLQGVKWQRERTIDIDDYSEETGFLAADDGSFRIYCMNVGHPRAHGWGTAADWHRFVADFLAFPI